MLQFLATRKEEIHLVAIKAQAELSLASKIIT